MVAVPIGTVRIRPGKEKQLVRRHPWVFSGAFDSTTEVPDSPGVVRVEDASGDFIAYGWHDRLSHIPVRLLSWRLEEFPDVSWWVDTLGSSVKRRLDLLKDSETTAIRLVHGEADFLPGLAVDAYGDRIVCIISARVAWDHRHVMVHTLQKLLNPSIIMVMVDSSFGGVESLKDAFETYVDAKLRVDSTDEMVHCLEHSIAYQFLLGKGQKSGFFCDQRDNRVRVASYSTGKDVLDAFCYSGGFTFNALKAGARSVTAVDSSAPALEMLSRNLALNMEKGNLPKEIESRVNVIQADMFEYLRTVDTDVYDMVILDPPKLARTKNQVDGALRAYMDLNRLAMMKLRQNGVLASFSCSGGVSREQLRTVLAWAAKDVGREVQILETLGQGPDHPIRLSFPESEYLKGYVCRVL